MPDLPAGAEERPRLFFALWPDAATAAALDACARRLHRQCGGRPMRRDTLHLTLAFLGEQPVGRVDELKTLAASLAGEPFDFVLSRAGSFQRNRVVWGGPEVTPPALVRLAQELGGALRARGFPVESRPFSAHVTLVRNARQAPPAQLEPAVCWRVASFALMRSRLSAEGARYEALGRWPLSSR